jgi:chromosome partitioning protein
MGAIGKIIAIANQKGGVAKTTTAVNLSAWLSIMGQKVLLVDLDPQGNATTGVGVDKQAIELCIYDVLINGVPTEEVITTCGVEELYLIPATIGLAGAEVELVGTADREKVLKRALEKIKDNYDFIFIDCPPPRGRHFLNYSRSQEILHYKGQQGNGTLV